ncbi:MAG: hypothetical protein AAGD40_05395 [Pseudomonadota bacterium]
MAKPPPTPPRDHQSDATPKREQERHREETAPAETLRDITEKEKGYPEDAKTSWN